MIFESKKELKEEIINAEERATKHFRNKVELERKLNSIKFIIDEADRNKELYVFTIDKIKRVLDTVLTDNN